MKVDVPRLGNRNCSIRRWITAPVELVLRADNDSGNTALSVARFSIKCNMCSYSINTATLRMPLCTVGNNFIEFVRNDSATFPCHMHNKICRIVRAIN